MLARGKLQGIHQLLAESTSTGLVQDLEVAPRRDYVGGLLSTQLHAGQDLSSWTTTHKSRLPFSRSAWTALR